MKQATEKGTKNTASVDFFKLGPGATNILSVLPDVPHDAAIDACRCVTLIARDLADDTSKRMMDVSPGEEVDETTSITAIHMLLDIACALSEAAGYL